MDRDVIRTWGPVLLVLALLPLGFVGLRSCLPVIGPRSSADAAGRGGGHAEGGPEHVGSASCAECHPSESAAWASSTHARAESPVPPDLPWTVKLDGKPAPAPVRALGVDPLVQLLIPFDGGRLQVTQSAWDPAAREWFDVFADERQPGEWGHWTGGAMTWNSQCAACHSTGVDKGYDEGTDSYRTTVVEHGVGCGGCHGDVSAHARAAEAATDGGADPEVGEDGGDGDAVQAATAGSAGSDAAGSSGMVQVDQEVCAACHARRAELTGDWRPGDRFLDHFAPQLVDRTDAHWPDGQVREEDFEYTAFLGSAMHQAGVTCASCHDPHSGKLRAEGDALCLSCHAAPGFGGPKPFAPHDPHQEPVGCAGCHMPVTTYMQRDRRHDHGFVVPDPELAVRFGVPDPCTRCHDDPASAPASAGGKDPQWAAQAASRWWPDLGGPRRDRNVALALGKQGDPAAIPGLLQVLSGGTPGWRAAAAAMLEGFVDRPEVRAALIEALEDPDGHVRFAATGALGPVAGDPAVEGALAGVIADPLRAVRVQAARSLRHRLTPSDPEAADYVAYLAHNADTPAALHERGTWALEQDRVPAALQDLRRAVQRDPRSAAIREALALAFARYDQPAAAAEQLREAVRLAPDDAPLWFRLGLAEAGVQDLAAAEAALAKGVELDPRDARGWYNLGLVRQQRGQDPLPALREAESLSPTDPEPGYAVAAALWQAGRTGEAQAQARKVLALAPDHAGARSIVEAPRP